MVHTLFLKLVFILSYLLNEYSGYYVNACEDNERYYHGVCEPCDECVYPGYFLNKTTLLPTNEYGNLECFPCDPCPEGTYRSADSFFKICFTCMLDCKALNRFSDQACGGPYEGNCGNCLDGYEPPDNIPNSQCREKEKRTEVTIDLDDPKSRSTSLPEQFKTLSNFSNIVEKTTDSTELERSVIPHGPVIFTWPQELWVTIIVVAVAFTGLFLFAVLYRRGCLKHHFTNTNPCSATVFSSFSSNASGNPLTKSDLETDCLPAPECQPLTSEGPAALGYENEAKSNSKLQLLTKTKQKPQHYPKYHLIDTSAANKKFITDCFMAIASGIHVYGPNKIQFYKQLGLKPSEYYNEDKSKDHVYDVLRTWHQTHYPGTLEQLCSALDKADKDIFHDVALELVRLYQSFDFKNDTVPKS